MGKNILLIGPDHLSNYQEACEDLKAEVRTTQDLKSTLDAIEEKTPDLLLVDHEVLQGSSIEICQTLKKYPGTQRIALMFIVPRTSLSELLEILFIPVNDYIFLPLDLEDFRWRVRAQLELADVKEKKKLMSVDEKIEELEKLVEIFPNYNAGWQELAEIYERVERIEDALKALLKLSQEYYQQSNFGQAMDVITRMKGILAKKGVQIDNQAQFNESLERCLQILK